MESGGRWEKIGILEKGERQREDKGGLAVWVETRRKPPDPIQADLLSPSATGFDGTSDHYPLLKTTSASNVAQRPDFYITPTTHPDLIIRAHEDGWIGTETESGNAYALLQRSKTLRFASGWT